MIGARTTLPRVDDVKVQRALDTLLNLVNQLSEVQILNGRLIKDVTIEGSGQLTRVAHGLGRLPQGYIVVAQDANDSLFEAAARTDKYFTFDSGATFTVSLWVF